MSKHQELRAKLMAEIDAAQWEWLKPHAERDRLILVAPDLDLLDAAVSIAGGDLKAVEDWMKRGWISKPTGEQLRAFDSDARRSFRCLIVQPWVLIQERSN